MLSGIAGPYTQVAKPDEFLAMSANRDSLDRPFQNDQAANSMAAPLSHPHLFVFGLGYTGRVLARSLNDTRTRPRDGQEWTVSGTARSPGTDRLPAGVSRLHRFDGNEPMPGIETALDGVTHLLASVPPGDAGDPVLAHHRDALAQCPTLRWVGYLSTTGVYGTRDGGWVDETADLRPTGTRGRRRVDAEAAWRALLEGHGLPVHIFRLAGIYGPGRNQLESLRAGTAKRIDKPGQVFSRIHVDDIVRVLRASMDRPDPGAVYNVCDDDPANPADVVAYAAGLLGVDPPPLIPFDQADLSPMGRSFYADNKRVRNDRIKADLGVSLLYPSYREGLTALLETID
jgi:nucleoside-diphosphate-sugar epimerase